MDTGLPAAAAWRHHHVREGFEVLFARAVGDGLRLDGRSTCVEDGLAWGVHYELDVDERGRTRSARVTGSSAEGAHEVVIEGDGEGAWLVDGAPAPQLEGCLDVDLEASACTNALPVRRLALAVGERADAPAVFVRQPALAVERVEQVYARIEDENGRLRFDYESSSFAFQAVLVYDTPGLILEYPGIAVRVA